MYEILTMKNFDESFSTSTQTLMGNFSPIKLEDLHQTVLSISHAIAPHNLIRTVIFKKLCSFWGHNFFFIISNTCIETGVFPDDLKKAVINPTFKNKNLDPEFLASYRPLSNLVFLSKLFEKLTHAQLVEHLTNLDLIYNTVSV